MNITITYCKSWNYYPYAASLAGEIKRELGVEPKLIGGYGGIYDIKVDDKLIYSKDQSQGRFPVRGEIVEIIKREMGQGAG